jgi:hypothetical protein
MSVLTNTYYKITNNELIIKNTLFKCFISNNYCRSKISYQKINLNYQYILH